MTREDYTVHTLPNGLRVAHKRVSGTRLVHCGFIIHSGSRHDGDHPGLAHCLEHMVFKGTQKRKTLQVLNHLEVVGGEMNAFTTKDLTAIYASVQSSHFARAIDILCDITLNSNFPEKELQKEKRVIAEEILMYQDTPEENIYDEFQEMVFRGHPLAHNILGSVDSLGSIRQEDLFAFTRAHYNASNMVLVVIGNVGLNRTLDLAARYSSAVPAGKSRPASVKLPAYTPESLTKETDHVQSYSIFGGPAYAENDPRRWTLLLLNNLLGGPGLNSRLNLAIREKYGLTYHVESGYQAYEETGLFHCYVSCEPAQMQRSTELILKELKKLCEKELGPLQLSGYKNQLKGQMIMGDENRSGLMVHIGKGILRYGKAHSLQDVLNEIDAITSDKLLEVAREIFNPDKFSYLNYIPAL